MRVIITDAERRWIRTFDRRTVGRFQALYLPSGKYQLRIESQHCAPQEREIEVKAGRTTDLGQVSLVALRVLTGRILDKATGLAIPSAVVLSHRGETLAIGDERGVIEADLEGDATPALAFVEAPGYARHRVVARPDGKQVMLGTVEMVRGGALTVTIDRGKSPVGQLDVELLRNARFGRGDSVRKRVLAEGTTQTTFEALEPDTYVLLVSGPTALERMAVAIRVVEEQVAEDTVTIEPMRLRVVTKFGDRALPRAVVRLSNKSAQWQTELTTDEQGSYEGEFWQGGSFNAAVTAPEITTPYLSFTTVEPAANGSLEIVVPDRRVRGRVRDRKSKQGIRDAEVMLGTRTAESSTNVFTKSGADGEFEFTAVVPGEQTLVVSADGYLNGEVPPFVLYEHDQAAERIVELRPGSQRIVQLRSASGAPVAGGRVTGVAAGHVESAAITDDSGSAKLLVPGDAPFVLCAFAPEGPFRLHRLPPQSASSRDSVIPLVLPPGTAELRLVVQAGSEPVAGVLFVLRYDGEFLPPSAVPPQHALRKGTDSTGTLVLAAMPPGGYELWPYRSPGEAEAILASSGGVEAPIVIHVASGQYSANVNLRRRP